MTLGSGASLVTTGEVKRPETINYRTFTPEPSGLFCEKIFGAILPCPCGNEAKVDAGKRDATVGRECGACGQPVALSPDRRRRFGHVSLPEPVAHIWFREALAAAAGLTPAVYDRVIYREQWVVILEGTSQPRGTALGEAEWEDLREPFGKDAAATGAGAIATLIGGHRAIFDAIPVLPAHLRPFQARESGTLLTSDVNDLYRRVINRRNRLQRLLELNAPEIILRNEGRMVQEAVDATFDNRRRGATITGPNRRPLRSLADMAGGLETLGASLAELDGALASGEITLERPKTFHRKLATFRALGFAFDTLA